MTEFIFCRLGGRLVGAGPASEFRDDGAGRALCLWHPSGDVPRILLWETSASERIVHDYRDPHERFKGPAGNDWWPGLDPETWQVLDEELKSSELGHLRLAGASSYNTPRMAAVWAIELLVLLNGRWTNNCVHPTALEEALKSWRQS